MSQHHTIIRKTQNLGKTFSNGQVLRWVDLQPPLNSILGFLGANQAGKATTQPQGLW